MDKDEILENALEATMQHEVVLGRYELSQEVIEKEIAWHKGHGAEVSSDYAEGFIKGLEHASAILKDPYMPVFSDKKSA